MIATSGHPTVDAPPEAAQLRQKVESLTAEVRQLELQVRSLKQQLWGRKSERVAPAGGEQKELFALPPADVPASTLPRETIVLPAPELKDLICPETKQPRQPGFVEQLEVLARQPAAYYVKRFECTVYVSPAKTAPVATAWPADVLPRARMHASVVAHLATAHFADHQPYYRLEQQLARVGVELPRNCQVSLMAQLDRMVEPLVKALRAEVLGGGYVHLDATPIPLLDPARPGAAREATLWAYRGSTGSVWFDFQTSKSPQHPDRVLRQADYRGLLQVDGASELGSIGPPGQVITLGCHAHLRRYFFQAVQGGERPAEPYLREINRLFRLERLARHFRLKEENRGKLRKRYSVCQRPPAIDPLSPV